VSTQLSTVKSTILTAASASEADHISALIAHLTSAPNQWELADSSSAHLIARLKAAYTDGQPASVDPHVGIWNDSGTWRAMVDPDKGMSFSAGFSGSAKASPQAFFASPGGYYTKSLLIELDDCLIWILPNAAKTAVPYGAKLGNSIQVKGGLLTIGIEGFVCNTGLIEHSTVNVAGYWWSADSTPESSYAQVGPGKWVAASGSVADGLLEPNDDGVDVTVPALLDVQAQGAGSSSGDDFNLGYDRYFAEIADRIRGIQPCFTVIEGATHAWLYVNQGTANNNTAVPWEKGVSLGGF
jgi:hypothetical protein